MKRHVCHLVLFMYLVFMAMPSGFAQNRDMGFTSLQPCVLFDTRSAVSGRMAGNEVRAFHVVGSLSDFVSQGGAAAEGCGIPGFSGPNPQVQAVLINLIAINATGGGNLKAWAADQAETQGGVVNYQRLEPNMNNSNAVVIEVRQDVQGSDIFVRANGGAVHVRGVALGYFTNLQQNMCWDFDGDVLHLTLQGRIRIIGTAPISVKTLPVNGLILQNVGDVFPDVNPVVGTMAFKPSDNAVVIHLSASEVDPIIVPSFIHIILDVATLEGTYEQLIFETDDGATYFFVRGAGNITTIDCPT